MLDAAMIEFRGVNKYYGSSHVLVDLTETIARGEVVVICGPSGSGKSTLIRTINRLEPIDSGRIILNGQDIHAPHVHLHRLRAGIGFVFQAFNLFPHLSAAIRAARHGRGVLADKTRLPP